MTFAIKVRYDILSNIPTYQYVCSALDLQTTTPETVITEYKGKHVPGKTDLDVLIFDITRQKTDYLPRGLSSKYINMNVLYVMESGLKSVTRDDFSAMPKLREIALFGNKLESIPNNCFNDLILLERLSLRRNKIKTLSSKIFRALPNLKAVYLSQNLITAIPSNLFVNNLKLENIGFQDNSLEFIGGNILKDLRKLKEVNFINNICINNKHPKTSINNLVKIIKQKCNILPVNSCASISKEINRLQILSNRLSAQQKKYDDKKNALKHKCGHFDTQFLSSKSDLQTTEDFDDLEDKYTNLQESFESLAASKNCVYNTTNGPSHIELVFKHES